MARLPGAPFTSESCWRLRASSSMVWSTCPTSKTTSASSSGRSWPLPGRACDGGARVRRNQLAIEVEVPLHLFGEARRTPHPDPPPQGGRGTRRGHPDPPPQGGRETRRGREDL